MQPTLGVAVDAAEGQHLLGRIEVELQLDQLCGVADFLVDFLTVVFEAAIANERFLHCPVVLSYELPHR